MGSGELAPKLLPASTGHRQRSAKFSYDQMALHARTASAKTPLWNQRYGSLQLEIFGGLGPCGSPPFKATYLIVATHDAGPCVQRVTLMLFVTRTAGGDPRA